jgi:hypothetical protein
VVPDSVGRKRNAVHNLSVANRNAVAQELAEVQVVLDEVVHQVEQTPEVARTPEVAWGLVEVGVEATLHKRMPHLQTK